MALPITYQLRSITTLQKQWHDYIEILYVLSGKLTIELNQQLFNLSEDQLILINRFDMHSLSAHHCKIVSFKLNIHDFNYPLLNEAILRFDCNSATVIHEEHLSPIKAILARLIKDQLSQDLSHQCLQLAHSFELLHLLINNFIIRQQGTTSQTNNAHLKRLEQIIHYINLHYAEPLTLETLAKHFFITPPYLSKIFKDHLGTGFKDYLNQIRLSHVILDISHLEWSIDFIADRNGFPSARTLTKAFKDKYKLLPSDYRNELKLGHDKPSRSSLPSYDTDLGFKHHQDLGILARYLDKPQLATNIKQATTYIHEIPPISVAQKGHLLLHNYKTTTSIGKAKQLLYAQSQEMLKTLQHEVGFSYIKFHGLLDDDMMVYSENALGEPEIDFTYVDMAIDFLISIGLKPFLELSFMPKALAAHPERRIFFLESIISLPKDYNKWLLLIHRLFIHFINRYGRTEVRTWFFFLWNEPDSPETMFGFDNTQDFFYFYRVTYEAIKSIDADLSIGTPSLLAHTVIENTWFKSYIHYCQTNHCMPDFINYHFYPVAPGNELVSDLILHSRIILDSDADALKNNIYQAKKILKAHHLENTPIYITEWNSTISQRDLLNDTAFKATYVVKNILENYDAINSFGYWSLSDFIEEVKVSQELFHGGMGLFTYNGIKKSPYFAYALLSKLGDTLIGRGDGYFITKHRSSIQLILYNYQHYSHLYAAGELFDMTFTNRYTPFIEPTVKKYVIPISDLEDTSYILTDILLNQENGSPFDKWVDLGAIELESQDEMAYLKAIAIPRITKQRLNVENGYLTISRELQPHEVRFIEIRSVLE